MFDMVMDEFALGVCDCVLDGMKLLREVNARSSGFHHRDYRREMAVRSL